jgi:amino acid transporter
LKTRRVTLLPLIAATYFIVSGGPFGIEDIVAKAGYAGAMLIFVVTPLVWSLPTALMVSEMASTLPEEGGFYVWARRALGPFWGFQEAWLSLAGSVFDVAIYPTLFVEYLRHFAPAMTAGHRGLWIGVALIVFAALWNLLGASSVGEGSVVLGLALLAPFAALAVLALFHRAPQSAAAHPVRGADLLGGLGVAMWNYMGWDNSSTIAGEVDRPQRTYPLAMAGAVTAVALSYILTVGAIWFNGLDPNRWTTGGWGEVARAILPGKTALIVAFGITAAGMISALGTLNGQVLVFSRLPAVMADDGYLPGLFAWRDRRTGAPWIAVLACSIIYALSLGLSFTKLVLLDVLLTGLSILIEFASLVALRVREPDLPRPFRVPGGLAGAVALGLPPLALLVLTAARSEIEPIGPINALLLGAILILLGIFAWFVGEQYRRHDHR